MSKTIALGIANFEDIVKNNIFYVDKTLFIKKWYENQDQVTLITRPRRFGKTLTLSMIEAFFSLKYKNRRDLFENFQIWQEEKFIKMQGTKPVLNVSLANIKQNSYKSMLRMFQIVWADLFERHRYLYESDKLSEEEKVFFKKILWREADEEDCMTALNFLASCMSKYYDQKVYILIDEYDTPILEAYVSGYWEEAILFIRRLFHSTLKDNVYLERALLTGITRITQESIFSDLNHLTVVTTTSNLYETDFGFTEEEVFAALEEYGLADQRDMVKEWYDGFQFGKCKDIYNPWSIIHFLRDQEFKPFWMNTSGNVLVGKLIQEGMVDLKEEFEALLNGKTIFAEIDESITYDELEDNSMAVWSWFLTTGYVKIVNKVEESYEIALTNYEVRSAFFKLVKRWFSKAYNQYNHFVKMLLQGNLEGMQIYLEKVTKATFSFFDVGSGSMNEKAEQFYHGFTLGLIADLNRTHIVTSNRESGFGRYDVNIEPKDKKQDGIIIEFKIFDEKNEKTLEETAQRALKQIVEKAYETDLKMRGIHKIRMYGVAFRGKEVLISEGC